MNINKITFNPGAVCTIADYTLVGFEAMFSTPPDLPRPIYSIEQDEPVGFIPAPKGLLLPVLKLPYLPLSMVMPIETHTLLDRLGTEGALMVVDVGSPWAFYCRLRKADG